MAEKKLIHYYTRRKKKQNNYENLKFIQLFYKTTNKNNEQNKYIPFTRNKSKKKRLRE